MKQLFVLILMSIFLSGCFGIYPGPGKENACTVVHKISYSNKGTRSEARHGHLFVNGNELPDAFSFVTCGDRSFRFYSRVHLWGSDGYFPLMKEEVSYIQYSEKIVGKKILKKGYYPGPVKYSDTPLSWMYVEFVGGSAFVNPEKVLDMLYELKPPRLDREKRVRLPLPSGKETQ